MKLGLVLVFMVLAPINIHSVHAESTSNNLSNEIIVLNNQKSGQCSPHCCDDDCDQ